LGWEEEDEEEHVVPQKSMNDWDKEFDEWKEEQKRARETRRQEREEAKRKKKEEREKKKKKKCHTYEETEGCVMGHNMKKIRNTTLEKCQAKCSKTKKCLGIEFFSASGRQDTSPAFREGDCLLNDDTDLYDPPCDAAYYQMYFWE